MIMLLLSVCCFILLHSIVIAYQAFGGHLDQPHGVDGVRPAIILVDNGSLQLIMLYSFRVPLELL